MDEHSADLKIVGVLGFLAIFGILGWHYGAHFHAMPLSALMAPFYRRGLLLVDYLFILAGFLAAAALANRNPMAGRKLIATTLARLYPLHLVTLCLVALMQWYIRQPSPSSRSS
jgi:peptidoglycan/LPS O-acetylase OafA/YrhL